MALRFSMSLPLKIEAVGIKDLERLHTLAVTTFTETFASQNTTGDLTLYLKNKLSKKQLMKEILNPNSVFYLSYYQEINVEYLKLNFKSAQSENTHKKDVKKGIKKCGSEFGNTTTRHWLFTKNWAFDCFQNTSFY